MPLNTVTRGIFQSDVVIRTAIAAAIADLRKNPWLLDYVFASLPKDQLTAQQYGERELEQAKKWFLNTDIPVRMNTKMDDTAMPCISIALVESSEAESVIGDIHYQSAEETQVIWPTIATFQPISYTASTGIMLLPEDNEAPLFEGMCIFDSTGKKHVIEEVLDEQTIRLAEGTVANFGTCHLKAGQPSHIVQLESVSFKESYSIGCHAQGEAIYVTYLHSIVIFALLRYKQSLLEARGFERSVVSSSDLALNQAFVPEVVFSRFVTITGYVRQYWPKDIKSKVMGIDMGAIMIDGAGNMPDEVDVDTQMWIGDEDTLSASSKVVRILGNGIDDDSDYET